MRQCLSVLVRFASADQGETVRAMNLSASPYRPHLRVIDDPEYLGVEFLEVTGTMAGSTEWLAARVWLIYHPDAGYEKLRVGREFEILEGPKVVGVGTVMHPVSGCD